jgi:hypothetical protein
MVCFLRPALAPGLALLGFTTLGIGSVAAAESGVCPSPAVVAAVRARAGEAGDINLVEVAKELGVPEAVISQFKATRAVTAGWGDPCG